MAGKIKIEFIGSWILKLYDDEGDVIDVWEAEQKNFAISPEAKQEMEKVNVVRGDIWG